MTHYGGWCRSRLIGGCAKPVGLCSFPSKAAGTAPRCWRGGGLSPGLPETPARHPLSPSAPLSPAFWGRTWGDVGWAVPCGFLRCRWMSPVGITSPGAGPGAGGEGGPCPGLATGAWGRIWPRSRRGFHPPVPAGAKQSVPGHCTLTRVQLWTLMDYKQQ